MARNRTVALIMPARNEEASAAHTLDSVFASTRLPDEIIVGDGLSTDRTVECVMRYAGRGVDIRVVPNPLVLPGAGRNAAVAASTADVLLLLDFGNTIAAGWIASMVCPFEQDESIDLVGGIFVPDVQSTFELCVAAIQFGKQLEVARLPPEQRRAALPGEPQPAGLSVGVSRRAWDRTGGMPDWLRAAEDKVFGRKLMASNPRWRFCPDAVLFHHMRSTPREVWHQMWTYFRGEGRTGRLAAHPAKLAAFHGAVLGLLGVSAAGVPVAALVAAALLLAYAWRSGVRPAVAAGVPRRAAWNLVPTLLLMRDAGIVAGQVAGLADWYLKPVYRRRLSAYLLTQTPLEAAPPEPGAATSPDL